MMLAPPEVDGHIFFIGREYDGPCKEVINDNMGNVPHPTRWDMRRTWSNVYRSLPDVFRGKIDKDAWESHLDKCKHSEEPPYRGPMTSGAAYTLRKILNGLVIGPLDKNNGECSALCPVLYKRVLEKLYPCDGEDYEQVFPKRLTSYRRKRYRNTITSQVLNTHPKMPKNQRSRNQRSNRRTVGRSWYWEYARHSQIGPKMAVNTIGSSVCSTSRV